MDRLSGGFSNSNYLISFVDGEHCVLRLSTNAARTRVEVDLLKFLAASVPDVPTPSVLWSRGPLRDGGGAFAMSYVDGELLSRAEDEMSEADRNRVCDELAVAASRIHGLRLGADGFFKHGASLERPVNDYTLWTLGYLSFCFDAPHFQRRLGRDRLRRLASCTLNRADLHLPSRTGSLCHGDFNQKNILVRRTAAGSYALAAIIDWEFALAGANVIDLGNLLRFESESGAIRGARFAAAYTEAGGELDVGWRQQAMFADLLAQCAFLVDFEEKPKTFATAVVVIDRTLDALNA